MEGKKSCFNCSYFPNCNLLKDLFDDDDRIYVSFLETHGEDCNRYFNPKI